MKTRMEELFSQFSVLADEAMNDKNFDPARIEQLLCRFEHEACASWSKSAKEAEDQLNSLMDTADKVKRSTEKELSALESASEKYMNAKLASASASMKSVFAAAKINKVHPF